MQDTYRPHPAERTHDPLSRRAKFIAGAILLVALALARFTYDYPRYLLPTFLSAEDAALLAGTPAASGGGFQGYGSSYLWSLEDGGQLAELSFYADDNPPGVPMVSVGPEGSSSTAMIDGGGDIRGFEAESGALPVLDVTVSCLRVKVLGVPSQVAAAAAAEVETSLRAAMHEYVTDATLTPCERTLRRR
jgi:hypothetical protein